MNNLNQNIFNPKLGSLTLFFLRKLCEHYFLIFTVIVFFLHNKICQRLYWKVSVIYTLYLLMSIFSCSREVEHWSVCYSQETDSFWVPSFESNFIFCSIIQYKHFFSVPFSEIYTILWILDVKNMNHNRVTSCKASLR